MIHQNYENINTEIEINANTDGNTQRNKSDSELISWVKDESITILDDREVSEGVYKPKEEANKRKQRLPERAVFFIVAPRPGITRFKQ